MRSRARVHTVNEANHVAANISISNELGQEVEIAHGVPWATAHSIRDALEALFSVAHNAQREEYKK